MPNGSSPSKEWLNRRQQKAVALLARGTAEGEVAKILKAANSTVSRWKANPMFASALREEYRKTMEAFEDTIKQTAPLALAELKKILGDPTGEPRDKIAAAKIIIDKALGDRQGTTAVQVNVSGDAQIAALCSPEEMKAVAASRQKALAAPKDEEKKA